MQLEKTALNSCVHHVCYTVWKTEAGNIAGRTATCVESSKRQYTQENGEVAQHCKNKYIFKNSTKESLSCNTKYPSDREDILWNPKFIYGTTAPSGPGHNYRGSTNAKGMNVNVI
jgi:hypothetical protein